jgi:hypothetical protein
LVALPIPAGRQSGGWQDEAVLMEGVAKVKTLHYQIRSSSFAPFLRLSLVSKAIFIANWTQK